MGMPSGCVKPQPLPPCDPIGERDNEAQGAIETPIMAWKRLPDQRFAVLSAACVDASAALTLEAVS